MHGALRSMYYLLRCDAEFLFGCERAMVRCFTEAMH
jgi:hypothetical protein